ncbi:MAG: sugar phosphate isomerase/epimerase family protein [Bacteroidota bacterium]
MNRITKSRRKFIRSSALAALGTTIAPKLLAHSSLLFEENQMYKISLAEWSLHKMLKAGDLKNIEFPAFTKRTFGINAVEYVNQFFFDKAKDKAYLKELNMRVADEGMDNVLIMIDKEGKLGDSDKKARQQAIENHYKWVEAAQFLGCHSIRVNAGGQGTREEVAKRVTESLHSLSTYAKDYDINVIVENHGGYSSDGKWLSTVIKDVGLPNCGTLPDFGNFTIDRKENITYDRYKGMKKLMPYAKAVSAKCYDFDESGVETNIDFLRIMKIVKKAGYKGYIGIEYEGKIMSEVEGIKAAKRLLEKTFNTI